MGYFTEIPTEQYIDLDFGTWYNQGLAPGLAEQFPDGLVLPQTLGGFEGQEVENFEEVLTDTLIGAHVPQNAYHNVVHAQRATENASQGYDAIASLKGWHIPAGFLQPILLGTAGHDTGHPGTTFFADAKPDRIPANASVDVAVEWHSARLASETAAENGFSPEQQAVAAYVPASSAYGEGTPQGQRLGLARVKPRGISGLMMRAADIVPAGGDFTTGLVDDMAVTHGEKPASGIVINTVDGYLANRKGFLTGYVIPTFDKLDASVDADLTTHLGWRDRAEQRIAQYEAIQKGHAPVLRAIMRSHAAAKYGTTLA
jgi:hypothetical protein